MPPPAIAGQRVQPIARWRAQILQPGSRMQVTQTTPSGLRQVRWKSRRDLPSKSSRATGDFQLVIMTRCSAWCYDGRAYLGSGQPHPRTRRDKRPEPVPVALQWRSLGQAPATRLVQPRHVEAAVGRLNADPVVPSEADHPVPRALLRAGSEGPVWL